MPQRLSILGILFFLLNISAGFIQAQCPDDTLPVSPASITICEGEIVTVTISGSEASSTYRLKDSGGSVISADFSGTGGDLVIASNALSASTTIEVEADRGACTVSLLNTVLVTVNPLPAAPTASNPTPICEGEATPSLTATGSGTLYWYSDAGLNNLIG
ncbi:MAG: hypothetical protein P8X57_10570, partial [Cyclobacteriaceae bacterium]